MDWIGLDGLDVLGGLDESHGTGRQTDRNRAVKELGANGVEAIGGTEHGQTGTATQHEGWHPQAAIEYPSECGDFEDFESKARGDRSGDRIF